METTTELDPAPSWLERVGRLSARRPGRTLTVWVAVLILVLLGSRLSGGSFYDSISLSGLSSQTGNALLSAHSPGAHGSSGLVVFHSTNSLTGKSQSISDAVSALEKLPHVTAVSNPLAPTSLSQSATTGVATIYFDEQPRLLGHGYVTDLNGAVASATRAGVSVNFGGGLDTVVRPKVKDLTSEEVGVLVAAGVLAVAFGSLLGALLPLLAAVASVVVGLSLVTWLAAFFQFGSSAPTLAAMIGLGVGIDYGVFLTTRFRQAVMDGVDVVKAAGRVATTSGRAVLVAASTVIVALLGLYASGITFIGQLGLAAALTVAVSAVSALTLVPALLGALGTRIDRWRVRKPVAESPGDTGFWHRYALALGRHPWRYLAAAAVVVLTLATPALWIQTGHVGDGADPANYSDRVAYDQLSTAFGPGFNGPFTVVLDVGHGASATSPLAQNLASTLKSTFGIARVTSPVASPDGVVLSAVVYPTTGPQSGATATLFSRLQNTVLPRVLKGTKVRGYVAGATAVQIQFDQAIWSRTPLIVGLVILLAFLLILSVFRSLVLALKAAAMNLLSIGAAYGVVVAVFQWGWGSSLLGISEHVPVEAYVPMMMFAIVFGLSMDYEVFLLSRIRESWLSSADTHTSVADGLAVTGRVISAAALIMVSVFVSFVSSPLVTVKELAVGLAASVIIDATVVRLVMVPSAMFLFGRLNWWIPAWLDRVLPRLRVE
ncbi:MAG: MMPL family transporter [Acidimicrobiaceae bacterium]|nr:MMPL family transporter [Acidimicrobiaceae bacterium]